LLVASVGGNGGDGGGDAPNSVFEPATEFSLELLLMMLIPMLLIPFSELLSLVESIDVDMSSRKSFPFFHHVLAAKGTLLPFIAWFEVSQLLLKLVLILLLELLITLLLQLLALTLLLF